MAIYQMNRPASPAVITMKFKTFNAAVDFAQKSGMMKASKPYKRMISHDGEMVAIWCVTMPNNKPAKATFTRIDSIEPKRANRMQQLQAA